MENIRQRNYVQSLIFDGVEFVYRMAIEHVVKIIEREQVACQAVS